MSAVDDALAVLRAAGWEIREDRSVGQLLDTDPPLLALTYFGEGRPHTRTVAQMPWTEVVA